MLRQSSLLAAFYAQKKSMAKCKILFSLLLLCVHFTVVQYLEKEGKNFHLATSENGILFSRSYVILFIDVKYLFKGLT